MTKTSGLKLNKREDGNVVSQMAGVLMMIFIFVMILAMVAFSRLVNCKMEIDNCVRNYLYVAEQNGFLSDEDKVGFKSALESHGCYNVTFTKGSEELCTSAQVPYGGEVQVGVSLDFENPIWQYFSKETHDHMFALTVAKPVHYEPIMKSTARW